VIRKVKFTIQIEYCSILTQSHLSKSVPETEKLLLQSIANLLFKDKYIKEVVAVNLLSVVLMKFSKRSSLTPEVKEVIEDLHYLLSH